MKEKKLKRIIIASLVSFAIFASYAGENLLKNGNFKELDADKKLVNWSYPAAAVYIEKDEKDQFVRLKNNQAGQYIAIKQTIQISPDWETLTVSARMRVNSINEDSTQKPGDVPRAMIVFLTSGGEKHYRPLCHISDPTNNLWLLRYETVEIVPDAKSAEIIFDLPGVVAELDVNDAAVYADAGKIVPLEVLNYAGKFEFRRTKRVGTPPGWIIDFNMSQMDNPPIRIEREFKSSFLRVENTDPAKSMFIENIFKIEPDWKKVNVSAKIRTQNLKCGSEGWQNARVMVTFTDAKGNKVGGYGDCPSAKVDQDWTVSSVVREVPEGAAGIRLQVGFFNSTGIADFDDISVTQAKQDQK